MTFSFITRLRKVWFLAFTISLLGLTYPVEGGGILREVWQGIGGVNISDLTNSPAYPDHPTTTNLVTAYFEAPTDVMDQYGQRMHGYIIPPVTGNYRFWVASDDAGQLWLSTDDTPANKRLIASVLSWTSSREWTKESNQQSSLIYLEQGRYYYIAALMKEGGGGDNLAVRWLRPDGVDEGPISCTNLQPWGITLEPPRIAEQPTNTSAIEGQRARFSVRLSSVGPANFQWHRNATDIPGANSSVLDYGPVTMADQNARFSVFITNNLGSTNSAEATLTVLPDTTPPTLKSALNFGTTTVRVIFSEPIAAPGATNPANYKIDKGVTVSSVSYGGDNSTVFLTTSSLSYLTNYTITVSYVTDQAFTPNPIAPGSQISFTAVEYAPQDIGSPALAGGSTAVPGGFDVTGAGTNIGGTTDQFQFSYRMVTGDFDLQARVANVTITDPFVQAGLVVRDSLAANGREAGSFASSAQLGCYFWSRTTAGAAGSTAVPAGGFPVNYPQTWLRLKRSSSTITGYASLDAVSWVQLGTATFTSLPSTLYFGLAACSQTAEQTSTAQFRDIGNTVNALASTYTPTREPLGPSSRNTGTIISEIMYHPPARADGKDLAFVELFNGGSVFEDLTGWRLSGDIDYQFPGGFKLQAGAFVVVAANPADLQAVYGLQNVLGPYTNALPHDAGTIRLRNNADAIRLEVNYSDNPPWPAAADGAGHSLVLARPSYGENDPQAWAASELIGGSPGQDDPVVPTPLRNVMINEILAHTDPPLIDSLELYNHSIAAVDLSGCYLSDDPKTNKFRIPDGTTIPARGFLAYNADQLGFHIDAGGETLFLVNSNVTRVLDAVRFEAQGNAISWGRWPDGAPTFRRLSAITLGTNNAPWRVEDVVINELMYNPVSGENDDEYIELYNRSGQVINLSGWKFIHGIDYTIPANTLLGPDRYLVVARNAARLLSRYPQLNAANTVGDYSGSLGNNGDRVSLAKLEDLVRTNALGQVVTNWVWVTQTEVQYGSGGRWGKWADGGGSSLELLDPQADPLRPSSWADSDESQKGQWVTNSFTGVLDNGNTSYTPNRLFILMQGPGECLVDDVEVIKSGSTTNLVSNSGFESGVTGWTSLGNHSRSTVDTTNAYAGSRCLHVRGQEEGDTGVNSIRTPLTGLASGNTATIRAKVRWVAGWPEVLFRFHGNYLEMPARMPVPLNLGTPGLPNSRRVPNPGPAIYDVSHSPALPRANKAVTVTCRVSDPNGIGSVSLLYRVDPSATLTTVVMTDDGTRGDAVAGDGVFSGTIPAQASGVLVAFRVQATDKAPSPVTSVFPAGAPAQECLVRWNDPIPFGNFPHHHLWSSQATENARNASIPLDNTWRDATLVYGNQRVIYNVGFRDKGSPWHGGAGDIVVSTPADDRLFGVTDRIYGSTGNGGSEETGIRSQLSGWLGQQLGIPYLHASYLLLYRNGGAFREVMEDLQAPNTSFAESWFPTDTSGELYKVCVWFEFDDGNLNFNPVGATIERFLSQGSYKLARYRWNFKRNPNDGMANNYTNFFALVTAANDTTANYVPKLLGLADIEQWMRIFGYDRMMGNWDDWAYNVGQNMYVYKQPGRLWVLMPWDIDFTFGLGDGPTAGLWGGQDPVVNKMFDNVTFRRMLWRVYIDAANGPFLPQNYAPQVDARRKVLLQNNILGLADPSGIKDWIEQRRAYLLSQIAANDAASFAITSNSGNDFTSTSATATLTGTAPFAVATIEVNGVPYPVSWTGYTTYQIKIPLTQATNRLALVGKDLRGNPVPGASDTITVTYLGAIPQPQDYVGINEVHYNPLEPKASFIELYNRSTTTPFDLSNFRLDGVGYTFPTGAVIQANSYLVLVRDRTGFGTAYGSVPIFDQFPGKLDNGGEHVALVKPGATPADDVLISDLRYDSRLPWPPDANGLGPSLQVIDPAQDHYRVGNWAATAVTNVNRVTPGRANSVSQGLAVFPPVWINEVLPANISGLVDNAGQREPWIELYNADTNAVDLSAFFVTDNYSNLTAWAFPAGTSIGPQQFLLLWADGQTNQTANGELHTSFRLNPTNGAVALVRYQGTPSTAAVMDYLEYTQQSPDRSIGCYPDGQPRKRRIFYYATPGGTNNPAYPAIDITINEFMAANTNTIADPADGKYDDWFELYNAGTNAIDLRSYTLTDDLTNQNKFVIPAGYSVPAGGFLLVWADSAPEYNNPTNWGLHTSFKLSKTNGQIGLFGPDGRMVDGFDYGLQVEDMSMGRFPDGAPPPFYAMSIPTPGTPNTVVGANSPPKLNPIGNRTVAEQTLLTFTASGSDPNAGQHLKFSLSPDAPEGASIDATTGVFQWLPTEAQGPGVYRFAVQVTDDGSPALTAAERITVTVTEVNRAPTLAPIGNQVVDEGTLLTLNLAASDPDLPANTLSFTLPQGGPPGMALDSNLGVLTWTPTESQGPAQYTVLVRVTDNGSPPLYDEKSFMVTVNEVNNPPVIEAILPQKIQELSTFMYTVKASDPDTPPSPLVYTMDTAPAGAQINPTTGVITWTPTEAQGPTNAIFVVRATESSPPNQSSAITFSVNVTEKNESPALAPISDFTAVEGDHVRFQVQGTDTDLPPQALTYSLLPGAPEGATIDPTTGWFDWHIDPDFGASTNAITVQVADNGPGNLTATRTLRATVLPQWHAIFSEVMYRPKTANGEFIELLNNSSKTTVDLSGIRMTGSNLVFNFANGSSLIPGARLLVVKNSSAFATAYPGAGPAAGQYLGSLGTNGDTLRLIDPGATAAQDVVLTEFTFGATAPWPDAANGGSASLQLIDPKRDVNRVGNWSAVPTNGLPTSPQWQQVTATGAFGTASPLLYLYLAAAGDVYVDDIQLVVGTTPGVGQNLIQNGDFEASLATGWNTTTNTAQSTVSTAMYHAGKSSLHLVCNAAGTTQGDSLWQNVAGLISGTTYTLSYWYLPNTNGGTLTVRFSGSWVRTDQNLAFQPPATVTQFTPGASNNVAASLPEFPTLRLNEVQTRNVSGLLDNAGEHEPWLELVNTGKEDVTLDGLYLSSTYANLTNWPFPAGWSIPAGGYLVVFADGEPLQTTATELHTGFRLPTTPGAAFTLGLSAVQNGQPILLDYLNGTVGADDASFGLRVDGEPASVGVLSSATPGASNNQSSPPVFISVSRNAQGQPVFEWTAIPGQQYQAEYKNDLGQANWSILGFVTAGGTTATMTDTSAAGVQSRFYRVLKP